MLRFFLIFCTVFLSSCISPNGNFSYLKKYKWYFECPSSNFTLSNGVYKSKLVYNSNMQTRCEISNRKLLHLNKPFEFSVTFKTNYINYHDNQWHSIFQIHSYPDLNLGEAWRCPILALEVLNGNLRMFNRWDDLPKSITQQGTCAGANNSIKSRLVFKDYPIEVDKKYNFKIKAMLSYSNNGYLQVFVNDIEIANIVGPNAYNDIQGPYFKIGIYKPTNWYSKENLEYEYNQINFIGSKIENQ